MFETIQNEFKKDKNIPNGKQYNFSLSRGCVPKNTNPCRNITEISTLKNDFKQGFNIDVGVWKAHN